MRWGRKENGSDRVAVREREKKWGRKSEGERGRKLEKNERVGQGSDEEGRREKSCEGGRTGQNVPSVYWTHCSQRRASVCVGR